MNKHEDTSDTEDDTPNTPEQQGLMETQSVDTQSMQDTPIVDTSIAISPVLRPEKPYITDEDFTNYKDMMSGAVNAFTLAVREKFQALESEISFLKDQNAACMAQIGDLVTSASKTTQSRPTAPLPTQKWQVASGRTKNVSWAPDVIETSNRYSSLYVDVSSDNVEPTSDAVRSTHAANRANAENNAKWSTDARSNTNIHSKRTSYTARNYTGNTEPTTDTVRSTHAANRANAGNNAQWSTDARSNTNFHSERTGYTARNGTDVSSDNAEPTTDTVRSTHDANRANAGNNAQWSTDAPSSTHIHRERTSHIARNGTRNANNIQRDTDARSTPDARSAVPSNGQGSSQSQLPSTFSSSQSRMPSVLVVGDSILKGIHSFQIIGKLKRGGSTTRSRVYVKPFLGAKTQTMPLYCAALLEEIEKPDVAIVHVGTNDIRGKSIPDIREDFVRLHTFMQQNGISMILSLLTCRADEYEDVIPANQPHADRTLPTIRPWLHR